MTSIPKNITDSRNDDDRVSVVEINGYLFGIDILRSKEVFPLPRITPVPNTRADIIGVFNHRGEIYPLLDISPILGLQSKTIQATDMVILLEGGDGSVGIVTDRIHGVRLIPPGSIKSPRGTIPKTMMEYVSGMTSDRAADILMLNVERLVSALNAGVPF
ncbi:MAG: purine-binding chemotaxis protein CheW [bacterium]|nr:MAG: purine-binding chemotaxis protein CheW [bacterium]